MRRALALAGALVALLAPAQASGWAEPVKLSAVASWLAQRPVTVRCLTAWESERDFVIAVAGAAAYVEFAADGGPEDFTVVAWPWCDVLQRPEAYGPKRFATAVLILVHESGHMRGRNFPQWDDEAAVNCWAARRAGAVAELHFGLVPAARPWFDALVWRIYAGQPDVYRFSACKRGWTP